MALRIHGKRRLKTLTGLTTRPTSSRVRQVVFDILQGQIAGSTWLDICSGSGTIGAEALCRGASCVVGIELSRAACHVIESNWSRVVGLGQRFQVVRGDARTILSRSSSKLSPFDFVYFDPPYSSNLYKILPPLLPRFIKPQGILIVEHYRTESMPEQIKTLSLIDQRFYGQTGLTFYRNQDETP